MEPEAGIKRQVLQKKLQTFRVTGYEAAVNAQLEQKFGTEQAATEWEQKSESQYRMAREVQAMLDALPEPSTNGDSADE